VSNPPTSGATYFGSPITYSYLFSGGELDWRAVERFQIFSTLLDYACAVGLCHPVSPLFSVFPLSDCQKAMEACDIILGLNVSLDKALGCGRNDVSAAADAFSYLPSKKVPGDVFFRPRLQEALFESADCNLSAFPMHLASCESLARSPWFNDSNGGRKTYS